MRRRLALSSVVAVATFVFGLLSAGPAAAQSTYTWNSAASSAWATPASWTLTSGSGTAPPVSGDTAVFSSATGVTVTLATDAVNTVNVSGSGSWTWSTGTLTLDSGAGAGAFNYGSSATSMFTGTLAGGGALNVTAGTLIMSGTDTYTGLTTVNGGTLTLSGTNTAMSGGVTLTSGALNINSVSALGSGTFTINGGTIDNTSAAAITTAAANAQSWGGNFNFGATNALTNLGAVTLTNNVQVTLAGPSFSIAGAGTNLTSLVPLTVGAISGASRSLTVAGTGALVVASNTASSYTGGTTINSGGTLVFANLTVGSNLTPLPTAGTLTISGGGTLVYAINTNIGSGIVVGTSLMSGSGSIYVQGNETQAFESSEDTLGFSGNTNFTGTVAISSTRISMGALSTLGSVTGLTVLQGGQLFFGTAITVPATVTITLASSGWYDSGNAPAPGAQAGAIRLSTASTIAGPVVLSANARISPNVVGGTITGNISGPFTLEVGNGGSDGSGNLTLTPSTGNTFGNLMISGSIAQSGTYATTANTVIAGNSNAFPAINPTTTNPSTMGLIMRTGGVLELNGNNATFATLTAYATPGSVDVGGLIENLNASTASTITIGTTLATAPSYYAGTIVNGAAGLLNLVKAGPTTLTLAGANTYTGTTTVQAGTLAIAAANSLPAAAAVTVNDGANFTVYGNSSTLTIASVTAGQSTGATLGFVANGVFAAPALTVTNLALNTTTTNLNFSSSVLIANGSTIPLISYTNSTGTTAVTAGGAFNPVLPPRAQGSLTVTANSVSLSLTSLGAITWAPGGLNTNWDVGSSIGTGGTTNWNGPIPSSGYMAGPTNFVSGDAVIFDSTAASGAVNLTTTVTPNSITFNNTTSLPYTLSGAGSIGGAGAVTINGAGTVTLATANSYAGGTIMNAGQLNINNAAAIGPGTLTITGGTISNTSGASVTLSTNNPQLWNGNFTFAGNNSLNLGAGAVTLGANVAITVNSTTPFNVGNQVGFSPAVNPGVNPLYIGGVIGGGAHSLTVLGNGIMFVAPNLIATYTGGTTVGTASPNSGALVIGTGLTSQGGGIPGPFVINAGGTLGFWFSTASTAIPFSTITGAGTVFFQGNNANANLQLGISLIVPTLPTGFVGTIDIMNARLGPTAATGDGNATLINILTGAQFITAANSPATAPMTLAGNGWFDSSGAQAGAFRFNGAATYSGNITLLANARMAETASASTGGIVSGTITGAFQLEIGNGGQDGFGTVALSPSGAANAFAALMVSSSTSTTGVVSPNTVIAGTPGAFPSATPAALIMNGTTANANAVLELNSSTSTNTAFTFANLSGTFGTIGNYSSSTALTATFNSGSYAGLLSNGGGAALAVAKTGAGTLTLTGANSYSGGTFIQVGTLSFANGSLSTGPVTFTGNSILQWNGTNTQDLTASNQLAISDGVTGTIDANGNGLTFTSTIGLSGPNQTGALQVITSKVGGSLTLSGSNSFQALTVGTLSTSGGTVTLSGSDGSLNTVNVTNGILRVQTGSISSTAAVAVSNAATLSLFGFSTSSSNTTLNVNSLALGTTAGVNLNFELTGGNPLAAPLITVGNMGGLTIPTGKTTINLSNTNPSSETVTGGTPIVLIQYLAAAQIPNIGNLFQIGSLPAPGFAANLSYQFSGGIGRVDLNITAVRGSITWTGNQAGGSSPQNGSIWNAGTTAGSGGEFNWTVASASTNFVNGDSVIFDDSASTTSGTTPPSPGVVTVMGTVSPYSVTFNNNALPYTLSGGAIAGSLGGGVTIANGGTVTLTMANTYTGTTTLANGQLNLSANGTATSSPVGAGMLVIGVLGGPAVTIDNTSAGPVALSTNNAETWNNNFTFGSTQPLDLGTGAVQLGQSITITLNGANSLTVGGPIGDSVGGVSQGYGLTVGGANTGTLILSGASTYTGNTFLNNGTLQLNPTSSLASASISVASGTTLLFPGLANSGTLTYTSAINGGGTWTLSPQTARSIYLFTGDLSGFTGIVNIGAQERFQLQSGGGNNLNSAAMINVANTGQFFITASTAGITIGSLISIAGSGVTESAGSLGAIRLSSTSTGTAAYAGSITLTANASIGAYDSSVDSFILGTISGGNFQLQMVSGVAPANDALVLQPSSQNVYGSTRVNNTAATSGSGINLIAGNSFAFSPGPLSLAGGASSANLAILQLNGNSFSFANLSSDNAFAQIQNNSPVSSATITIGSDNTPTTYSGTLINGTVAGGQPLSLFKTGTGTLILTGASTYTGGTTIDTGTLQLGNGGATGSISGPITINTATLAFNLSGTQTFAPAGGISSGSSPGAIIQMGPGSLTLSGPNLSFNGSVTVMGGVLRMQSASLGSGASVAVNDGTTLAIFGLSSTSSSLSVASLALGSAGAGSTFQVELSGSSPTAAAVAVGNSNGVTRSGTTTVNLVDTALLTVGEVPLISYTGTQITSGFTVGALPTQRTVANIDYGAPGLVQLNVTVPGFITWTGLHSTAWDVGTGIGVGGTNNWSINGGPTNFFTGDAVLFDDTAGPANGTVTLAATVSPSSVTFNNTAGHASSVAYSLSGAGGIAGSGSVVISGGGAVTLSSTNTYSGGTVLSNGQLNINGASAIGTGTLTLGTFGGPNVTIDNTTAGPVALTTNNAQTWAGNFTFAGSNALNLGTGTVSIANLNLTVTMNGSQPLTVGGTINDLVGGVSQGFGLTVNGTSTGMLNLSGLSSYTGPTTINGGTLNYLDGSSLASSPITVNPGGTLLYTMNAAGGITFSVTINNKISGAGNWTLAPTAEISPISRSIYIFSGDLSGFSGTLTINNADRFQVTTGFNLGGGTSPIVVNPGGQFYMLAPITVTNPISIIGDGLAETAGTLGVIRFQPGTYAGPITLVGNAGVTAFNSFGTITGVISGPYQFALVSGMAGENGAGETLTLTPTAQNTYGSTRVDNSAATAAQNVFLKAGNALAFSTGGLSLSGAGLADLAILQLNGFSFTFANLSSDNAFAQIQNGGASAATITVGTDNSSTMYSGTLIDGSGGASLSLAKSGTGMLTLTGVNSFTGGTTINSGILSFANGSLGTGPIAFAGNSTLQWNGTNSQDVSSKLAINDGVNAAIDTNGNNVTFASPIGVGPLGTGALTKVGGGTLFLTAANTYSGGTTIVAGTLKVNSDSALGATTGAVSLNGGTLQFAAGGGVALSASRNIILSGGAIDTNFANDIINGVLSGSSLIKTGAGVLTITNTNNYTGSTIVNGGALLVSSTGTLGGGPLAVNNPNTAVPPSQNALFLLSSQIVGPLSGTIAQPASGNGSSIFLGSGATLTINQTAAGVFQGSIYGPGNLTLSASSNNTLQLSNNNTYSGSTIINGGTVQLNKSNQLPAAAGLSFAASVGSGTAATLNLNNNDQQIASLSGGSGSSGFIQTGTGVGGVLTVVNPSGGSTTFGGVISGKGGLALGLNNTQGPNNTATLVLTGPNNFTGPVTVNSGTLRADDWTFTNGNPVIVVPITSGVQIIPNNCGPAFTYTASGLPILGTFTLGPSAASFDLAGSSQAIGSLQGGGEAGGNITLGNGGILQIIQSQTTIYAGVISGNGTVIVGSSAGGVLILANHNTFNGSTYADLIQIAVSQALPINNNVIFTRSPNDGLDLNGRSQTLGTISGGGPGNDNGKGTILDSQGTGSILTIAFNPNNPLGGPVTNNFSGSIVNDVSVVVDAAVVGAAQTLTLSGTNNSTGSLTVGNATSPSSAGAHSGAANSVVISGSGSFGALAIGNMYAGNIINSVMVSAVTGNLTVTGISIGDSAAGSTGVNTLTVGGTVTSTGDVNIGSTNSYGVNTLTVLKGGTLAGSGNDVSIVVGNFSGGSGTLNANGNIGTAANPVGTLLVRTGGLLAGGGTITTKGIGTAITNNGGTIRGGVDSSNSYGTLTIAPAGGTSAANSLVLGTNGQSGMGQATTLLGEVQRSGIDTVNASLIQLTGINKSLNINTSAGGVLNINLNDPTASLLPGERYIINLVQTSAIGGSIRLNGRIQSANTVIDSGASVGTGSGNSGIADLYITGNNGFVNNVTGWSLGVNSAGNGLQLSVSTATPEPGHIVLMCVGVLLFTLAIRRKSQWQDRFQRCRIDF